MFRLPLSVILREPWRPKDLVCIILKYEQRVRTEARFFKSWNSFQNDNSTTTNLLTY